MALLTVAEAAGRVARLQMAGKLVVFTNGVFDLLHPGHVRYLAAARKISRAAVGDPDMGVLVNTHITPVRQPQDGRNEELPFGPQVPVSHE